MKRIIVLLFIIFPLIIFCQGDNNGVKNNQENLIRKIEEIEKKVLSGNIALEKADSALKKDAEVLEISRLYAESANNLVRNFWQIFAITIAAVSLFGSYLLIKLINYQFDKKVDTLNRKFDEKTKKIISEKEEIILSLIKKHEFEKGLLQESKLLILNKSDTSVNEYIELVLNRFSNKIVKINIENLLSFDVSKVKDLAKFDLVLFDNTNTVNESKNWNFKGDENPLKEKLIDIAKETCNRGISFIFFGTNDGEFAKSLPQYSYLINFSNSPSTIFSNIINLLNFRKMLLLVS